MAKETKLLVLLFFMPALDNCVNVTHRANPNSINSKKLRAILNEEANNFELAFRFDFIAIAAMILMIS